MTHFNDLHEAYSQAIANPTIRNMSLVRKAQCEFTSHVNFQTGVAKSLNTQTGQIEQLPSLPTVQGRNYNI